MKHFASLLLVFFVVSLSACNKGYEINGHSLKTALRSVKGIKEKLSTEKRLEFELAFGLIRENIKDNDKFLDEVDGKDPEEIIAAGKTLFDAEKSKGLQAYQDFSSWDDMISKYMDNRINQDKKMTANPNEMNKPNRTVLYKL